MGRYYVFPHIPFAQRGKRYGLDEQAKDASMRSYSTETESEIQLKVPVPTRAIFFIAPQSF